MYVAKLSLIVRKSVRVHKATCSTHTELHFSIVVLKDNKTKWKKSCESYCPK